MTKLIRQLLDFARKGELRPAEVDIRALVDHAATLLEPIVRKRGVSLAVTGGAEDLYYRINVVELTMPPLRARGTDVLLLAQTFLEHFARQHGKPVQRLSSPVAERLLAYAWPGNIRELRNCIDRAVALARFEEVIVEDLPVQVRDYRATHVLVAANDPSELVPLAEVERRYIERVMEVVGSNKRQAAQVLGVDRATLYRKLERWGPRTE